jgi:hypothetical protein
MGGAFSRRSAAFALPPAINASCEMVASRSIFFTLISPVSALALDDKSRRPAVQTLCSTRMCLARIEKHVLHLRYIFYGHRTNSVRCKKPKSRGGRRTPRGDRHQGGAGVDAPPRPFSESVSVPNAPAVCRYREACIFSILPRSLRNLSALIPRSAAAAYAGQNRAHVRTSRRTRAAGVVAAPRFETHRNAIDRASADRPRRRCDAPQREAAQV